MIQKDPLRNERLDDIWDAVLARPIAERAAFLREACEGDDALRHELEATLVHVARAEVFLEQPLSTIAAQVLGPSSDTLKAGQRLDTLEIGPLIGAGGMGQVYRARDTELNRDVAVKVLPPEVADDPERLARFGHEARALASLNHPNVAHIHGLQHSDGVTAIVMELVQGETLAQVITRGPLAIHDTLAIARQVAEALEAAHGHGVVHRDLKPANVLIRDDGVVKLVDFGLAKSVTAAGQDVDVWTTDVTLSSTPGVVLGTAAYMAPEQIRQKPVDRRADLWALGCLVFEMLSGRAAFVGASLPDVLLAVTEREPPWDALPASTPAALRRLLERCLEKDVKNRLDSAAVARLEIDDAERAGAAGGTLAAATARRGHAWMPRQWLSIGALLATVVAVVVAERHRSAPPRPMTITSIPVEGLNLWQPGVHLSVAPNGRTVVYVEGSLSQRDILRRDVDRLDPDTITTGCCKSDVFISDDGRQLGFEDRSELWATSLDGGAPRRLQANHALRGGAWGAGGRIVVGRVGSGLWVTSAAGGESRPLTFPGEDERHELPQLLPGGRAVLFTILATSRPSRAAVVLVDTGEVRELLEGSGARYAVSGHLVFGRDDKLWAVSFDPDALQAVGSPVVVRDDVLWSAAGYPQFAVGGGTLAYVRKSPASTQIGKTTLSVVDRRGTAELLPLQPDNYHLVTISPEGERFVVQVGPTRELWVYDFVRGTFGPLTRDRVVAYSAPAWTPDGTHVVFTTWFDGEVGLGLVPADGSGTVDVLAKGHGMRSYERTHPTYLPDGSGLVMTGLAAGSSVEDLLLFRLTGEPRLEPLVQAPGVERNPAIDPSGRLLAYNSDESGRAEVYVRPLAAVGARRWTVSTAGGSGPRWTRGGRELIYLSGRGEVMSVKVRGDDMRSVEFSSPQPLFATGHEDPSGIDRGYDVSADGSRFLFRAPAAQIDAPRTELVLIQHWADELTRLAPRDR